MIQLKFNDKFDKIISETPLHWQTRIDIPSNIIDYINDISDKRVVYNKLDKSFYCEHCLNKLDEKFYCRHCGIKYDKFIYEESYSHFRNNRNIMIIDDIDNLIDFKNKYYYYVFDISRGNIILYIIKEKVWYDTFFGIRMQKISIYNAYYVNENEILDIKNDVHYIFEDIDNEIIKYGYSPTLVDLDPYDFKDIYLYTDNFEQFKNTIYRHTDIWNIKDKLKDANFNILNLLYYPIHKPQFEYLVKLKLYNLAFYSAHLFKKGKTFKEIFGIGRDYLAFMQEFNISYDELEILKLCKKKDIALIDYFYEYDSKLLEHILNISHTSLDRIKNYFEKNNIESYLINEYCDYLEFSKKLGLNLKDKSVLFPDNLIEEHNRLYMQMTIIDNPKIDDNIKNISSVLKLNNYEDDDYVIFPANSIKSMIDEGTQQSNCLRTYLESYSDNDCQIYFMRRKSEMKKSFVTIEVRGNKIIQARTRFNKYPGDKIMDILKNWERNLVTISSE